MSVLVYIGSYGGNIHKSGYEAVAYGKKVADDAGLTMTCAIIGPAGNLDELGSYGATRVIHKSDASYSSFDPSAIAAALDEVAATVNASIIVMLHDFTGKSVAPRLSARLKAGLVTGVIGLPSVSNGFTVRKAVFSGKAFAEVEILSEKKIISIMPNSFNHQKGSGKAAVEVSGGSAAASGLKVKEVKKESSKLSLTEAETVVSAGRGLKGPENWGMVEELAGILGAATACSRPVADIGWRPHHEHVGQTGTASRPNLYIAIGISGAIQHLAGVNGSKVIVVINIDPEAPFFKAADYGIVGDAFEVVPKLIEAARAI